MSTVPKEKPEIQRQAKPAEDISLKDGETKNKVDAGLIEVNLALAAIGAGVITFLPEMTSGGICFKLLIGIPSAFLTVISSYNALWILARYCRGGNSALGIDEIKKLLQTGDVAMPYFFMTVALLIWFIMSFGLVILAIA